MNQLNSARKTGLVSVDPPGSRRESSPSQALGLVLRELNRARLTDQSSQRMAEILVRFTVYIEKGHGLCSITDVAEDHVEGFVFAPGLATAGTRRPSTATMHLRRSALRLYFRLLRQLGLFAGDPTLDLVLPPRSCMAVRPLTDDEVALCRSFSLHTLTETRQPAAWALAEATARTSEISSIRLSDLKLQDKKVWIHGASKMEPRWGRLSEWGAIQLQRRAHQIAGRAGEPFIVYEGCGSEASQQASSCAAIAETLTRAGLSFEPDVRPGSVAAWAGRHQFMKNNQIDEVALLLGVRSLDRAARLIGWEWDRTEDAG